MKLGCSSASYREAFSAGRIDLREWLRLCAEEMDLDGVELAYDHFVTAEAAYMREIKRICVERHLTVAGIAVHNDFGPDETRAAEVEKVRRACDIAAIMGAPIVTVFGSSIPSNRDARDAGRVVGLLRKIFGEKPVNIRAIWSDMTYALRACADYAGERGIVLAVQNSQSHGLVADVWQLDRCLHAAGSPWLRACLDPADLADRRGMDVVLGRTAQVRARVRQVREDGSDRAVRWPEILSALRLGGYRGFIAIDYNGAEHAETAVPRAARNLRGALHLLDRQQLLAAASASTNGKGEPPAIEAPRSEEAAALGAR